MKITKWVLILAGFFLTSALIACNTVQGAGEDLQAGGHAIAKAADKAKPRSNGS